MNININSNLARINRIEWFNRSGNFENSLNIKLDLMFFYEHVRETTPICADSFRTNLSSFSEVKT